MLFTSPKLPGLPAKATKSFWQVLLQRTVAVLPELRIQAARIDS